jgi:hypothetical protein
MQNYDYGVSDELRSQLGFSGLSLGKYYFQTESKL